MGEASQYGKHKAQAMPRNSAAMSNFTQFPSTQLLILLRAIYIANIIVAGTVGWMSLFDPNRAATTVFSSTTEPNLPMGIVGSFWLTIALLSVAGLFSPVRFSIVLLVQLIYKSLWLIAVAVPAILAGRTDSIPIGMAIFFLIWAIVLPFVIPFRLLF
jgi:hypothetical protein